MHAMRSALGAVLATTGIAALAACAPRVEEPGTEAAAPPAPAFQLSKAGEPPRLLVCARPASPDSAVREIGPAGGTVAVRGSRLQVPEAAVGKGLRFVLLEPASDTVRVEVRPDVPFQRPATLTISYARCPDPLPVDPDSLRIYRRTRGQWTDLGGPVEVDRDARTVTTRGLDHLSQYAVGSGGRTDGGG